NKIRIQVSSLRRQAATTRRYLAPQRDALDALYRQAKNILDQDHVYEIHEQSDRIVRYVEDLDLVRERALVLQEELMNRIAQEQNARMYVLSIVAAVFLPISFLTGLFGMNVAGLPGVEDPEAFLIVAVLMGLTVAGILLYFRNKKWL
ncbi:MAG: CorA family divalent cation transporter, partial [Pseudohongiellaceae bacterium]